MDTGFRPEHTIMAPEFPSGEWLNSPGVRLTSLRGKPVIVYFWDYASLSCLTFLSEIRRLERRYAELGVAFIGIHTPAFSFERERQQVALSAQRLPFAHPTLLDNEYAAARAFHIPALPAAYLIDPKGKIISSTAHGMRTLELKLQKSLRGLDPTTSLPSLNPSPLEQIRRKCSNCMQAYSAACSAIRRVMPSTRRSCIACPTGVDRDASI